MKYLLHKLFFFCSTLFLVITFTFFLMKALPGDPFTQEQTIPEEIMKSLYAHYGLDEPLHIQYIKYLKGVVTWNLGPSFKHEGRTINDVIADGFPVSALLGTFALIVALVWGIACGSIAALYRGKWQDFLAMTFSILGMSVPSFIFATLLQYFFAIKFPFFPIARWGTLAHMVLPGLALAAFPSAFIAKLTRSSMIEVQSKEFILTAQAKGLSPFKIWRSHILKNSLLPIVSYTGSLFANIMTGSFVIEKIFGIPGLGYWFVSSIGNRDYTMILGLTIFYSTLFMLAIFCTDLLLFLLDPRIKSSLVEEAQ